MTSLPVSTPAADRVIVRGIHLELTPALTQAALLKASHLLDHAARIERIRIDLEHDRTHRPSGRFIAKGRLEISGPDLMASAESEDAYKSLDLLVAKLDELLRRRHEKRIKSRNDPRHLAPDILHGEK
jgi:putative sigma-54 modulation protein